MCWRFPLKGILVLGAVSGVFGVPATGLAQESILARIHDLKPAIVAVKAQIISDVFKSKPKGPFLDPKTGRIVVLRNLTHASFDRQGAGVIIHPEGLIATNAHNVFRAKHILVTINGETTVPAQIVKYISNIDLAILKVTPPFPLTRVELADSNQINLGDHIIHLGSSYLLNGTITGGTITGLGKSGSVVINAMRRTDLIQTSINLYEGDSGGPLFDNNGRLIGLMTAKETGADHSSFAVPANNITLYLNEYLTQP